jgi:protease IV
LEGPLRKLKKADKVKAVVVRVDSPGGAITACETIHQHLADLPQKVVVSFGNVSASGGYYISANSERIFASPTTITGSIGVVMLRADLRGLAHQWGIHFDSIPTSELSGSFDPFFPVNGRMKDNFANFADRAYLHFKRLVSEGRGLKMDQVEAVAQGRVWTGHQAKEIELVDELGGLHRAIAYCQREFTESGHAQVIAWPPKKSLYEALMNRDEEDSLDNVEVPGVVAWVIEKYGTILGLHHLLLDNKSDQSNGSMIASLEGLLRQGRLPMAMSGMMLTLDENAAIRCLLEDNSVLDVQSSLPPAFYESF